MAATLPGSRVPEAGAANALAEKTDATASSRRAEVQLHRFRLTKRTSLATGPTFSIPENRVPLFYTNESGTNKSGQIILSCHTIGYLLLVPDSQ
jgi:hypothetical protein